LAFVSDQIKTRFTTPRMKEPGNIHTLEDMAIIVDSIPIFDVVVHIVSLIMLSSLMSIFVVGPQSLGYEYRALIIIG